MTKCDVRSSMCEGQDDDARSDAALPRSGPSRMRGLTLLELLLALAGTAVIGTAVAAMLTGVLYGTQSNKDLRSLITRQMALRARLEAAVRQSHRVLDQGTGYVILWGEDVDESGTPNKSEIEVIELDAGTGQIIRYAAASGIVDVEYTFVDDFRTLTDAYKGDVTFPAQTWASEVATLTFTLDDADPQLATLVAFRIGLTGGEVPDTAIGAAALRNEANE